jgi:DNA-binding transcriptional ArsR family regulator
MGITRSDIFTDDVNKAAQLAKAFAHPARFTILRHLIHSKACIVNDLVDIVGLAQPTISQHLKELKSIGIIKGEIEGPRVCYCINEEVWDEFKVLFTGIIDMYDASRNCCK